ncbi:MAG: hypothetical protein LBN93_00590 [Candidatus Symbiothrix sp.]|jgi:hypothetical protein|nr:hypothetical protein [Candidatus Symbiothrix sp.]
MKKLCLAIGFFALVLPMKAQETSGATFSAGADVVSSYVFRGTLQEAFPGVNVQPGLGVSAGGFSLGAWGSTSIYSGAKEVDLAVGYEIAGVKIGITDYWIVDNGTKYFEAIKDSHVFEANLSYTFPEAFPLTISWNTNFAGADAVDAGGDALYSTYVGLTYPFAVKGVDLEAEVGFTPWEGAYADNFNLVNVSLKASKEVKITDHFALPVFAQYSINPYLEDANLVFGTGISF